MRYWNSVLLMEPSAMAVAFIPDVGEGTAVQLISIPSEERTCPVEPAANRASLPEPLMYSKSPRVSPVGYAKAYACPRYVAYRSEVMLALETEVTPAPTAIWQRENSHVEAVCVSVGAAGKAAGVPVSFSIVIFP